MLIDYDVHTGLHSGAWRLGNLGLKVEVCARTYVKEGKMAISDKLQKSSLG